jgi:hypothetical protein
MNTPEWAEASARLADVTLTPAWEETAAALQDLASNSVWGEPVSALAEVLADSDWVEEFADAAGIETVPTAEATVSGEASPEAAELKRKRGRLFTITVYLTVAIALHLSNYLTTPDPVFDPHLFLNDEFMAIGLALTFFCAFWKD